MEASPTPDTTGFDAARLIEQYQVGVWRYLRALGCEPAQADDLTQETFLAVLQHPFRDYGAASTAAYLRKVARSQFISAHRRGGKVKVIVVEDIEEFDRAWDQWAGNDSGEARLEALRECLQVLTSRARLALEMRFRERGSRANIAAALGISEHGAKNLMQRAKRLLRECIEGKLQ
jgi:RNA polymerase sigma-70 factor (ECF subfamily)